MRRKYFLETKIKIYAQIKKSKKDPYKNIKSEFVKHKIKLHCFNFNSNTSQLSPLHHNNSTFHNQISKSSYFACSGIGGDEATLSRQSEGTRKFSFLNNSTILRIVKLPCMYMGPTGVKNDLRVFRPKRSSLLISICPCSERLGTEER